MEKIIFTIIILFIFWLIVNYILKQTINRHKIVIEIIGELDEYTASILNYRKSIMFDIIVLIILTLFNIKFLIWPAIIYYIIIGILEGILLIIAFISGLDNDLKNKKLDKDLWTIFIAKFLNEISTIIMIFTLILKV